MPGRELTAPLIESLQIGPRPGEITGAPVKDIHFFHENHPPAGAWICMEGFFSRHESQFGADYLILKCPTCGMDVQCEGESLRNAGIAVGALLLLRGHMPLKRGPIEMCRIVSQHEIDEALEIEGTTPAH